MINPGIIRNKVHLEMFIWIAAILLLVFLNPYGNLYSICPLKYLGFHYCPGCGLGRSIALLFRGRLAESFAMHPFGIFAILVIGQRIIQLARMDLPAILHATKT
jgi:hypothetical protein